MQNIHFVDNTNLDLSDKYAKLRPLLRLLIDHFANHFRPEKSFSHDKAMIEYFGRHGCKQCIRSKPIRFGYKVWCTNTADGYLCSSMTQSQTYEGDPDDERSVGKFGATVIKNFRSLPLEKQTLPYDIYFDNLFTSLQLFHELLKV